MDSEEELQEEEVKEELRKKGCSEILIEHWLHPKNLWVMDEQQRSADSGWHKGPCGDSMEIYLKVKDGIIQDASYMCDVCLGAVASGSMLTEMIKGKKIKEALYLKPEDILKELKGLPSQFEHCAELATKTLKLALADYQENYQHPWKKIYANKVYKDKDKENS